MLQRLIVTAATAAVAAMSVAAPVGAEPDPVPPLGGVESAQPGFLAAPDGWKLTVSGKDETLLPVQPLTTAVSSREYLVGGTFTGAVSGAGDSKLTGGTLEVGYRIGCGIIGDVIDLNATGTLNPQIKLPFTGADGAGLGNSISGMVRVHLKPGVVNIVPVTKLSYKGLDSRATITGFRIKIDSCAGQSFIQSYATLTGSTDISDNIITYVGNVKVV